VQGLNHAKGEESRTSEWYEGPKRPRIHVPKKEKKYGKKNRLVKTLRGGGGGGDLNKHGSKCPFTTGTLIW